MSEEQDIKVNLQQAFDSYMAGEAPSAIEIAQAPIVQNWRVVVVQIDTEAAPLMLPTLVGKVTGHPGLDDGKIVRTSQLVWLDRARKWARTWNRVYQLGERAGEEANGKSEGMPS